MDKPTPTDKSTPASSLMERIMQLRNLSPGFLAFALTTLLAVSLTVPLTSRAQVHIPSEAIENVGEIQALLSRGKQLERELRWGEALSHYESALREHPRRTELKECLTRSRFHFDLGRRYADQSFKLALDSLPEQTALDLYSEVLQKINFSYVHSPNWRELVSQGTTALEVAVSDSTFINEHLRGIPTKKIKDFRNELHRTLDWRSIRNQKDALDAVSVAARLAQHQLGVKPTVVILEYTCGAIGSLDVYSSYLTATQLDDVYSQIEGNFVGLGVELKAVGGALQIVTVIVGSPAEKAGILAGDRFVEVDGHSTTEVSTDRAADMLKGDPGSVVELTVLSSDGSKRRVQVRRQRVEVPSVDRVKLIDPQRGIGYLRLISFQKTTSRDIDAALWELHRRGMKCLIVDVRGNPGGLLDASVEVVDKFVTEGMIVSTRGRSPREDNDYRAHRVGTWHLPLVVLIDEDTASASEIFAGAIHDHQRGKIVGRRSYGKGSVQGIFPLSIANAGVRMTTAKFYSPLGQAISNHGVHPDILVRIAAKPIGEKGELLSTDKTEDPVLEAGLQVARRQLSKRQ